MAGRWARLAVRAQATSALDYRQVSADNPRSLAKEELLLREMERQLDYQSDVANMLATMIAPMKQDYLQRRSAQLLQSVQTTLEPWSYGRSSRSEAGIANEGNLEDYYHRIVESNRKRQALKKKQLEEDNA